MAAIRDPWAEAAEPWKAVARRAEREALAALGMQVPQEAGAGAMAALAELQKLARADVDPDTLLRERRAAVLRAAAVADLEYGATVPGFEDDGEHARRVRGSIDRVFPLAPEEAPTQAELEIY